MDDIEKLKQVWADAWTPKPVRPKMKWTRDGAGTYQTTDGRFSIEKWRDGQGRVPFEGQWKLFRGSEIATRKHMRTFQRKSDAVVAAERANRKCNPCRGSGFVNVGGGGILSHSSCGGTGRS